MTPSRNGGQSAGSRRPGHVVLTVEQHKEGLDLGAIQVADQGQELRLRAGRVQPVDQEADAGLLGAAVGTFGPRPSGFRVLEIDLRCHEFDSTDSKAIDHDRAWTIVPGMTLRSGLSNEPGTRSESSFW